MGDGLLAEFASVVDAVECAVALQRDMAEHNDGLPTDRRIDVRIGINLGDVIVEGEDRHGEGVIIAARLEQLAAPGGIAVSRTVVNHVKHKLALRFESLGDQKVKNIAEPIAVYRVVMDAAAVPVARPHWSSRHRIALISWGSSFLAAVPWGFWGLGWLRQEVGEAAPARRPAVTTVAAAESASLRVQFRTIVARTGRRHPGDVVLRSGSPATGRATWVRESPSVHHRSRDISQFQVIPAQVLRLCRPTGAEIVGDRRGIRDEGSIRRIRQGMVTMQLIRGSTDRTDDQQLEENLQDPVAFKCSHGVA
jgi:hypothetical protein